MMPVWPRKALGIVKSVSIYTADLRSVVIRGKRRSLATGSRHAPGDAVLNLYWRLRWPSLQAATLDLDQEPRN